MSNIHEPKKIGAPSVFNQEKANKFVGYAKRQCSYELAAQACGINDRTLHNWLAKGREHHEEGIVSEFSSFFQELKEIALNFEMEHVESVKEQTNRWQARAWLLERHPLFKERYASYDAKKLDDAVNDMKKSVEEIKDAQKKYEQPI